MKFILALCFLAALLTAGCDTGTTNNYNTYITNPDTTHNGAVDSTVVVLSPLPGETVTAVCAWAQHPSPYGYCDWGYSVDTMFRAVVALNIPDHVLSAQVFSVYSYDGHFSSYGQPVFPTSDTFSVGIFNVFTSQAYGLSSDTAHRAFCVQVTTTGGSNLISRIVPYGMVERPLDVSQGVPVAPVIDTLYEYTSQPRINIDWCSPSPNVDLFVIYHEVPGSGVVEADTTVGGNRDFNIWNYSPLESYAFWMKSLNEFGASAGSDTLHITTRAPNPPSNLSVWVHGGTLVDIRWDNNIQMCDSILIARRDTTSSWGNIGALPVSYGYYIPTSFTDSTAVAHSFLVYRVGYLFGNGTWWSTDSVGVWIP